MLAAGAYVSLGALLGAQLGFEISTPGWERSSNLEHRFLSYQTLQGPGSCPQAPLATDSPIQLQPLSHLSLL